MIARWLIYLLIISAPAQAAETDIQKYQKALFASERYIQSLQSENKILAQKATDCDAAKSQCEDEHADFLGITKTHWAVIGFVTGFGLGIWAMRR